jgi:tripartite-type tricarboxylate transporter receptor subunit TctC
MKSCLFLLLSAQLAAASIAAAADATPGYPSRPIRLVVSSAPGTPPDTLARIVAEPLSAALGQPVIVENRPGGSGTIGTDTVAKAVPDGHTIGYIGLPQMVASSLMREVPYDITRDLVPVTQITWTANVLVVRAASPVKTIGNLVAVAKTKPGMLTYASAGNGSPSHLACELFRHKAGIEVQHIPYKGIASGLAALMGEQVDFAFAGAATALPLVRSGKLRALATAGARRLPAFPELPTIAELGFEGYQLNEWHGVVAPAGTSPEVVARLADALARIVMSADVRVRLENVGLYPAEKFGPEPLAALIRSEIPRWKDTVRKTGIRAD